MLVACRNSVSTCCQHSSRAYNAAGEFSSSVCPSKLVAEELLRNKRRRGACQTSFMLPMQHGRAYDVAGELSSSVSPFATRCSGAPLQQVQRLYFPFSHGLLWWSSTTTTDHRADAAELHRICPRSALAVLPQLYANCGGAPPQFAAVLSNPCC
jgi:hypothetical protein